MRNPLPNFVGCYVCGDGHPRRLKVRFYVEDERVVGRMQTDASHQGFPGMVHGGVLAALLDETMGWAPSVVHGRFCYAAEVTIRYLRPAPVGTVLIVVGETGNSHRRLWEATGEVRDDEGNVYARGQGKYIPLSEAGTDAVMERLTVNGQRMTLSEALAAARGDADSQ